MAYELMDLKKAIGDLEAKLDGKELAPFKMKLEFSLLQINTALTVLSSDSSNHENKYLLFKQLETTICDIQTRVSLDSRDHTEVEMLAKSAEFTALATARPFLVEQQKEWLPHYLERDLQTSFDKQGEPDKIKNLCNVIKNITSDTKLNAEQKTRSIDDAILKYATSKGASPTFALLTPRDPFKDRVLEWLTIHRQATINPLLNPDAQPVLNNTIRPEQP